MKKILLIAVVALAIASCGPKKADSTATEQDSIVNVDTISADTTQVDSVKVDTVAVK